MLGINLNRPILYKHSSLRFFKSGEHHISRLCKDDVLLLVYDGVLRFSEDGTQFEIGAGEYHIQRRNSLQSGDLASDMPKYLYVHFIADWTENGCLLPRSGTFQYTKLKQWMDELDAAAHSHAPYLTQAGLFYRLLSMLHQTKPANSTADNIADYIARNCHQEITLEMLCNEFHLSKNHVINIFKKAFAMTPIAYRNHIRLQKAEHMMEVTSDSIESISLLCGFNHYSHFYKQFLRKNGLPPEQWRNHKRL